MFLVVTWVVMPFGFEHIPDLANKVAIVTGANSGIGFITARELALKNCHVILACRTLSKTTPLLDQIKAIKSDANVEFMELNLMSIKSVDSFVNNFKARNIPLNILVNNAGVMMCPFQLSEDGIESQFATNHVGHFALTEGLLDVIEKSAPSRIVCVSSVAHKMAPKNGIDFENINNEKTYGKQKAYGQSKLANILFSNELTRRLEERGVKEVYVNSLHPGVINTDLYRHFPGFLSAIMRFFFLSADDGAKTQLFAAAAEDIVKNNWKGKYFEPIAKLTTTTKLGEDMELAKKLWDFTENLLKEKRGK